MRLTAGTHSHEPGILGVLLALAFACGALIDAKQLEKWVLFINSSLVVFSLPLAWLKWFWWRLNAVGDMVGILGGFPAGYLVWFGSDAVLPRSHCAPQCWPTLAGI